MGLWFLIYFLTVSFICFKYFLLISAIFAVQVAEAINLSSWNNSEERNPIDLPILVTFALAKYLPGAPDDK